MGICEFARHGIYTHSSGLSTDGVLARTPGMEPDLMFGSEWKSVTYVGEGGGGGTAVQPLAMSYTESSKIPDHVINNSFKEV